MMNPDRSNNLSPTDVSKEMTPRDAESHRGPTDLMHQEADTLTETMTANDLGPNGLGFGIRMIECYLNRTDKPLLPAHRRQLERAKLILQERQRKQRKPR